MKRTIAIALALVALAGALGAQQITRFAVVDTGRIYTTFYRDTRNVRDYEAKKSQYQAEIERMSAEIKALKQQKVDAEAVKDAARVARLESDIAKKTSFLLDYSKAKNAELDTLSKRLVNNDQFYSILYDEIRKIAEAKGYSMVLSMKDNNAIIWYSPTVDITDEVIRNMTSSQQQ